MRNLDRAGYRDNTEPIFFKFKCLKFCDIVKLKTLLIMYKAKKNVLPPNLQTLFQETSAVHNHCTRSSGNGNFDISYCRTKLRSMTISIVGVKLWNSINVNFRNTNTISSFKRSYKNQIISQYSST